MTTRATSTSHAALKERLQAQFDALREEVRRELLASDNERYIELAGRVHDPGDESVAALLVDVNLAVIDRHIEAIREIEAALLRLARGTYGRCVDCGRPIAPERLATEPAAARCYDCQSLRERAFVQPARPTI